MEVQSVKTQEHGWWVNGSTFVPVQSRFASDVQAWIDAGNTPEPEFTLGELKARQTDAINAGCQSSIVAGFPSSALGAAHTYQSELIDQINLMGAAMGGQAMAFKCADASDQWAYRNHTAAQLRQVFADGSAKKLKYLQKAATLKLQIAAATDQAAVEAIVW